ncbi:hypothetical protein F2P81_019322 [Scophthalmus maximus]|uniref:Uncharacterized protein n=1 Tax=Scophthalmus maximus TaxID=52904 RepID=A0A6A4S7H9_SCOMX|nr:hypothetical protein F2P81_019322 [Scophthalmus maximus]
MNINEERQAEIGKECSVSKPQVTSERGSIWPTYKEFMKIVVVNIIVTGQKLIIRISVFRFQILTPRKSDTYQNLMKHLVQLVYLDLISCPNIRAAASQCTVHKHLIQGHNDRTAVNRKPGCGQVQHRVGITLSPQLSFDDHTNRDIGIQSRLCKCAYSEVYGAQRKSETGALIRFNAINLMPQTDNGEPRSSPHGIFGSAPQNIPKCTILSINSVPVMYFSEVDQTESATPLGFPDFKSIPFQLCNAPYELDTCTSHSQFILMGYYLTSPLSQLVGRGFHHAYEVFVIRRYT